MEVTHQSPITLVSGGEKAISHSYGLVGRRVWPQDPRVDAQGLTPKTQGLNGLYAILFSWNKFKLERILGYVGGAQSRLQDKWYWCVTGLFNGKAQQYVCH